MTTEKAHVATETTLELAQQTALFGVGLLKDNYKKFAQINPDVVVCGFLAAVVNITLEAVGNSEQSRKDIIKLLEDF